MNKNRLVLRILTLPLIMVLAIPPMMILYFRWVKNWLLYGGEIIAYENSGERKKIADIYLLLKDNIKNE